MTMSAASLTEQLNRQALATRSNRVAYAPRPSLLRAWLARFQAWRRIRRDEAFLKRQPDHLLKDIGLERSEIQTTVRNGRFR